MNENYDTTYFSKSQHEIPWLFPDINPFSEFPWHYFKFPDNSLTLKKYFFPDFSLTRGNPANGYEMMHKAWSSIEEVPYCFSRSYVKFQGHTGQKTIDFDLNWAFSDSNSS